MSEHEVHEPTRVGRYEPFAVSARSVRHRVDRKTGLTLCGVACGEDWYRSEVADHHRRMRPHATECQACEGRHLG